MAWMQAVRQDSDTASKKSCCAIYTCLCTCLWASACTLYANGSRIFNIHTWGRASVCRLVWLTCTYTHTHLISFYIGKHHIWISGQRSGFNLLMWKCSRNIHGLCNQGLSFKQISRRLARINVDPWDMAISTLNTYKRNEKWIENIDVKLRTLTSQIKEVLRLVFLRFCVSLRSLVTGTFFSFFLFCRFLFYFNHT